VFSVHVSFEIIFNIILQAIPRSSNLSLPKLRMRFFAHIIPSLHRF